MAYQEYAFFRVRFNPKAALGGRNATVIISSDTGSVEAVRVQANSAPDKGEISILQNGYEAFNIATLRRNGSSVAMAAPSYAYQSGKCPKPFDGLIPVELKNRGPGTLHIDRAQFTLDEKNVFTLDASVVFPFDIAPNQSQMVNIILSPTAATGSHYWGTIEFTSQDTNESKYEFGFGLYKPAPAPCLAVLPHPEGQPADPNVDTWNYDLGAMGAQKRVGLTLQNGGTARLTVDEGVLIVGPFPATGSGCDGPTATIDLANGGGPVILEAGESHETTLILTGLVNCPAQDLGGAFPAQVMIFKDDAKSYPIIQMRGAFMAVGQSAVALTYGRNRLGLNSGDTLPIPDVGMPVGMRSKGSAPLRLVGIDLSSGEFKLLPAPTGPVTLSSTADYSFAITKAVATPKPTKMNLLFDNNERVIINLQ